MATIEQHINAALDLPNFSRQIKRGKRRTGKYTMTRKVMDDTHVFAPLTMPKTEVLLGVYGTEEWIQANFIRQRHLSGRATIQLDVTWLVPSNFSLAEWVMEKAKHYTFFGAERVLIEAAEGLIRIDVGRRKIDVGHIGDPAWVKKWVAEFDAHFKRAQNLIEWVYSTRGDEISVPLNYRPAINAAYPWIKKNLIEYIDDYLNSDASVLILSGPPGTGKTTFIKNLIHRSGGNAKVAYDEAVMMDDGLFAGFIDDSSRFLVMEDADAFLQSRNDGNTMMHKFLNVSDGLISAADKKMVFSTNLPKISDIDSALMRPGRCFDVLEFRALTSAEASAVIEEVGRGNIPDKSHCTLAEIFSQQPSSDKPRKKGIGFTP